jgi:transglutaminase-like putative cysteine protease
MRLRIEHHTTLTYDDPISEAYTEMRLRPGDAGGQTCLAFSLSTEPHGAVMQYVDRFGNDVRHVDVLETHTRLSVIAVSTVLTATELRDAHMLLSPLDEYDYLAPTRYTPHAAAMRAFAAPYIVPSDPFDTAVGLMHAIHAEMTYRPGATDVSTSATEVLDLRAGVCQDFAHLMLALCRGEGIPARYVSGYLYGPDHADDAASHAWVDVFIPQRGWISLDPTHDTAQTERYVRLGVGRDYADVPPTRGTYKGTAKESLKVKVMMEHM